MRLEPDSGHMEEEGCWGYRRAAKLPGSEAGVDAEAGIQVDFLRGRTEAPFRLRDAKGPPQTLQRRKTPGAGAAAAGMASRPDRQHRGSSARDGIAAVGCRHRMNPWPGPSRCSAQGGQSKGFDSAQQRGTGLRSKQDAK